MGHIFCPYLGLGFPSPKSRLLTGVLCPLPVLETSLRHFTCFFFFFLNRPGSLLGDIGVCEDWSPSTKGVPIKAEQMGEAGEVDRGSGQDAFHRGSFTEQEGGGTGHKDGALEHKDRGSPWASLAGCLATVGNHLSGPQGSQGGPFLSVA